MNVRAGDEFLAGTRPPPPALRYCYYIYSVYVEAQGGFRTGRSTTDSIFILHSILNSLISQNKKLYCAFLDLRKAFDCVDRNCPWSKLVSIGLSGNMYNIIHNMYESVKSRVKNHYKVSAVFSSHIGVRRLFFFQCLLTI